MSLEAPMPLDHQAPGAHTIRRAMLRPDRYLAAALAEWPDEDLANATRAGVMTVWQPHRRSCPRADRWHAEPAQPAALVGADVGLLRTVLGALGVRP